MDLTAFVHVQNSKGQCSCLISYFFMVLGLGEHFDISLGCLSKIQTSSSTNNIRKGELSYETEHKPQ